jgi:ectoine hydroxylase-related dioxygenase (phytanoyl-CoA dioxygenase family)
VIGVKYKITNEQKAFYDENGFVVIEDFLDAGELETWRTVTEDAVKQRLLERNGLTNQNNPDDYYSQVFVQCVRLADTHEGMAHLMLDERLGKAAGTLAGVDGIRIWHDQALFKQPYGNPTGWHLDNPYWSFYSPHAISIWVALDRATLANGCLWYMPGTHKQARYDNSGIGSNIASLFSIYPEWAHLKAVPAPCAAGSAVFHNGLVAHGAGANMTPNPRRAMTCAYMPDGSTFNGQKNVLRDDYFARLKPGDVIDDPQQTPLLWKRS